MVELRAFNSSVIGSIPIRPTKFLVVTKESFTMFLLADALAQPFYKDIPGTIYVFSRDNEEVVIEADSPGVAKELAGEKAYLLRVFNPTLLFSEYRRAEEDLNDQLTISLWEQIMLLYGGEDAATKAYRKWAGVSPV